MLSEIKAEEVIASTDHRLASAGKVNAVSQIDPLQTLPDGGKELPARKENTVSDLTKLDDAVKAMNDHVQQLRRELEFSVDKDSGRTVVKVLDTETREVIRQIPNDEALNFARRLSEGADLEIVDYYI